MTEALAALEDQYFYFQQAVADLTDEDAPQDVLQALRTAVAQSRTNYWKAINKVLHDDDPEVASLVEQMKTSQENIDAALKKINQVAKILKAITKAIDVGSELAAKAVAL